MATEWTSKKTDSDWKIVGVIDRDRDDFSATQQYLLFFVQWTQISHAIHGSATQPTKTDCVKQIQKIATTTALNNTEKLKTISTANFYHGNTPSKYNLCVYIP